MKTPLFCLFWTLFGLFMGNFPIRPVSMIPWLLNWIILWIESAGFSFNLIILWIESWVKQYWIEYWMNHFLDKFKYWMESERVSNTPTAPPLMWAVRLKLWWYRYLFWEFSSGRGKLQLQIKETLSCFIQRSPPGITINASNYKLSGPISCTQVGKPLAPLGNILGSAYIHICVNFFSIVLKLVKEEVRYRQWKFQPALIAFSSFHQRLLNLIRSQRRHI